MPPRIAAANAGSSISQPISGETTVLMPRIIPATAVMAPTRHHSAIITRSGSNAGDAGEIRIVGDRPHLPADRREVQGAEGDREAKRGDAGHLQIQRADGELADAVGRRQLDVEHFLLVPEDDAQHAAEQKGEADRADQQRDAGAPRQRLEDKLVAEHGRERRSSTMAKPAPSRSEPVMRCPTSAI